MASVTSLQQVTTATRERYVAVSDGEDTVNGPAKLDPARTLGDLPNP